MKNVISASRRTDIPAFYLNWFIEKIQSGYVEVVNPIYRQNIKIVKLDPDNVEWIVFWSRNYKHLLKHHEIFQNYQLFFHFTILPKSMLELRFLPTKEALQQLGALCNLYGTNRIIWRYDPIVHWVENRKIISNHDIKNFEYLCSEISQYEIRKCYTSFVNLYRKYERRFKKTFQTKQIYQPDLKSQLEITSQISEVANKYKIDLYSCCNDLLLRTDSINKGRCIDGKVLNELGSLNKISEAKSPSREDCGCTNSIDIGDYLAQPCYFGCIYCYANPAGY